MSGILQRVREWIDGRSGAYDSGYETVPHTPEAWRERAYANAAEVMRLQRLLAAMVEAQQASDADRQAGQILRKLEAWCNQKKPGPGFRAVVKADGTWEASLIECERRTMRGADLADALGQIAQTASSELP